MPPRHEVRERPREVIRRGLADKGATAGARLDDPEKLECAQRLADRGTRDLELLGELPLRRQLVTRPQVAALEESLDLLDDALVEAAAANRLDDCQRRSARRPLSRNAPASVLW